MSYTVSSQDSWRWKYAGPALCPTLYDVVTLEGSMGDCETISIKLLLFTEDAFLTESSINTAQSISLIALEMPFNTLGS